MQAPVMVLQQNTQREQGRKAQLGNVTAAKAIADIVRTTLGPRSMLKMLLDANGSIVLTNDGNAILREIDVTHPAAKSMIELSRTQDEEVSYHDQASSAHPHPPKEKPVFADLTFVLLPFFFFFLASRLVTERLR